ncbi:heavy metal-associated isoprenylated plant protein 39-like [Macadamia integrifolia]|uniref:heavy metal-associated isoprenylated plant protein 39-like n=1 Tax=Macadamia integrifolia TaxID=60698 RepID=UPI001C4FF886|nr:heavy metal-associated isoprenylated plant protein 39-like [Macadamia integrifolia]
MDPLNIVGKLHKYWHTEIDFIGPPEEPKAPELEKKEEEKKDEAAVKIAELIKAIELGGGYNYPYMTSHYHLESIAEENPNACCVIS